MRVCGVERHENIFKICCVCREGARWEEDLCVVEKHVQKEKNFFRFSKNQ